MYSQQNKRKTTLKGSVSRSKPLKILVWILCIGLAIPLLYFAYKQIVAAIQKAKELNADVAKTTRYNENQNPLTAQKKRDQITKRKDVQAAAQKIAHDLGTKYSDKNSWYSFLDPRGWTENDDAVVATIIKQRLNFYLLEKLYFQVESNSRSLTADLLALLDKDSIIRLRKYVNI